MTAERCFMKMLCSSTTGCPLSSILHRSAQEFSCLHPPAQVLNLTCGTDLKILCVRNQAELWLPFWRLQTPQSFSSPPQVPSALQRGWSNVSSAVVVHASTTDTVVSLTSSCLSLIISISPPPKGNTLFRSELLGHFFPHPSAANGPMLW